MRNYFRLFNRLSFLELTPSEQLSSEEIDLKVEYVVFLLNSKTKIVFLDIAAIPQQKYIREILLKHQTRERQRQHQTIQCYISNAERDKDGKY